MCCGSRTSRRRRLAPGRCWSGWPRRRSTSATGSACAARRCTRASVGCALRRAARSARTSPGWVEAVGDGVTRFRPGDEVYGDNLALKGGFAEYTVAPESALAHKPQELTFAEASTIPQAGAIALQGTDGAAAGSAGAGQRGRWRLGLVRDPARQAARCARDRGRQRRQARLHALARRRRGDRLPQRRLHAHRRAVRPRSSTSSPTGRCSPTAERSPAAAATAASAGRCGTLLRDPDGRLDRRPAHAAPDRRPRRAKLGPAHFEPLAELCVAGDVGIHIDRTFGLDEVPVALAHVGEGRALGKVVVTPTWPAETHQTRLM